MPRVRSVRSCFHLVFVVSFAICACSPLLGQSWTITHSSVSVDSAPAVAVENESSPAALLEPYWMIEAFYRGANGHLWEVVDGSPVTPKGYSNPVSLNASPDSTVWKGKVVVFYQGLNQHLFIASKAMFQPDQAFNDPQDTGYGTLTSAPSVSSLDGKEVDVFYRGANNHLWQMHFKDLTHWSAPEDLGGVSLESRPNIITMRDQSNKIGYQALYVGPNGHLWKSYWPSDLKKRLWWSAPEDLGGDVVTGGPVSINLPSAKGGPTDRGIETFYLTDSARGTDRLRFSTWVGYDSKGATDWWSGGQQIVIPGANFTSDLGSAIFGVTGPELYYRDGQGHFSKMFVTPPTPPAPPPTIKLSATPDNGYVNKGTPITITWQVGNCNGACSVSLQGVFGLDNQVILNASKLPIANSLNTLPSQTTTQTKYTMTATGTNGTATKSLTANLASSTTPACQSCSTYYFVLTNGSPTAAPPCFTEEVLAQSQSAAQQLLETENPGYTVTPTTAEGFFSACDQ